MGGWVKDKHTQLHAHQDAAQRPAKQAHTSGPAFAMPAHGQGPAHQARCGRVGRPAAGATLAAFTVRSRGPPHTLTPHIRVRSHIASSERNSSHFSLGRQQQQQQQQQQSRITYGHCLAWMGPAAMDEQRPGLGADPVAGTVPPGRGGTQLWQVRAWKRPRHAEGMLCAGLPARDQACSNRIGRRAGHARCCTYCGRVVCSQGLDRAAPHHQGIPTPRVV